MKRLVALALLAMPGALAASCTTEIWLGGSALDAGADVATSDASTDASTDASARVDASLLCVDVPVGTSMRSLSHAGRVRNYQVVRGEGVDPCQKNQAVFMFHGFDNVGSLVGSKQMVVIAAAARAKALVVAMEGSADTAGRLSWGCAGCAGFQDADDVGFVRAVVQDLRLDPARISAFGADTGGAFVHRLAGELPLAAGLVSQGFLGSDSSGNSASIVRPTPTTVPVTMFIQHGEKDPVFPFGGGVGTRGDAVTSFDEAVAFWRTANGCSSGPTVTSTAATVVERSVCGAVEIVSVNWREGGHGVRLPEDDPDNPSISFTATVDRLLAARR